MIAQRRTITMTPATSIDRLLDEASEEPVWLKRGDALFRLTKEPSEIQANGNDRRSQAPERGEHESSVDFFDRLRAHIMRGRIVDDDSTELIRQAHGERFALVIGR